jgi:hypothetical protein
MNYILQVHIDRKNEFKSLYGKYITEQIEKEELEHELIVMNHFDDKLEFITKFKKLDKYIFEKTVNMFENENLVIDIALNNEGEIQYHLLGLYKKTNSYIKLDDFWKLFNFVKYENNEYTKMVEKYFNNNLQYITSFNSLNKPSYEKLTKLFNAIVIDVALASNGIELESTLGLYRDIVYDINYKHFWIMFEFMKQEKSLEDLQKLLLNLKKEKIMSEMESTIEDEDFENFYQNIRLLPSEDLIKMKTQLRKDIIKKAVNISDSSKMRLILEYLLKLTA